MESLDEFDAHLGSTGSLAGVVVQSVDLTRRSAVLREADVGGAIFLGCRLRPGDASQLARAGALNREDENTARWYLERKRKDEFSTRQEICFSHACSTL